MKIELHEAERLAVDEALTRRINELRRVVGDWRAAGKLMQAMGPAIELAHCIQAQRKLRQTVPERVVSKPDSLAGELLGS